MICRYCGNSIEESDESIPVLWISPDICTDCVLQTAREDAQESYDLDDDWDEDGPR